MDVAFTKKYFSHVSALSLYENCRAYPTAMTTISRHMNCLVVRVRGGKGSGGVGVDVGCLGGLIPKAITQLLS